ncbi:ABC transporter ATP-binding protein [Lacibacterium aquatile]|uniref:ABC transporter ATP-binding protein n=1 Tax=Lacibacterium aquatile TaxID=1168082 RepID=A0ABW5DQQ4_9PROT
MSAEMMLEVKDLTRWFDLTPPLLTRLLDGGDQKVVKAVDGVSFQVPKGKTVSLVGESGCGKSTVARLLVGLMPPSGGTVTLDKSVRVQMIFQDPYSSLNPRWRVRDIVAEPIRTLKLREKGKPTLDRVGELLTLVGLAPADGEKYPHEFSGGQRQRISIARALATEAEFLVCDEPTSALDVSVQAQILNLMRDLQRDLGLTYVFISHNLSVVRHMSDSVAVMYLGRIVEMAPADELYANPKHPYTKLLLDTIPDLENPNRDRQPMSGEVPNPIDPPPGCTFHPRCPMADERCKATTPLPRLVDNAMVACHRAAA